MSLGSADDRTEEYRSHIGGNGVFDLVSISCSSGTIADLKAQLARAAEFVDVAECSVPEGMPLMPSPAEEERAIASRQKGFPSC